MNKYQVSLFKKLGISVTVEDSVQEAYRLLDPESRAMVKIAEMIVRETRYIPELAPVRSARAAYSAVRDHFDWTSKEEQLFVLLLDNQNRLIETVAVHGKTQCAGADLDLRKLVRTVIAKGASGIIFAHNHPSGISSPSPEDVEMTKQLKSLLVSIGVDVVDHIVCTQTEFTRIQPLL